MQNELAQIEDKLKSANINFTKNSILHKTKARSLADKAQQINSRKQPNITSLRHNYACPKWLFFALC